jgi:hypothetical protein
MNETQIQIIRQSSAKTAFDYIKGNQNLTSKDGLELAKRIEAYVITGK